MLDMEPENTQQSPLANLAPGMHLVSRPVNQPVLGAVALHWSVYDNTDSGSPIFHQFQKDRGLLVNDDAEPIDGYISECSAECANSARERLVEIQNAYKDRNDLYRTFENNCEHVARYVVQGEFKSEQAEAVTQANSEAGSIVGFAVGGVLTLLSYVYTKCFFQQLIIRHTRRSQAVSGANKDQLEIQSSASTLD